MTGPSSPVGGTPPGLTGDRAKLWRASQQLEAVFYNQLFAAMRQATPEGGFVEHSPAEQMFTAMFDERVAQMAAEHSTGGLTLAMYRQLSRHLGPDTPAAQDVDHVQAK